MLLSLSVRRAWIEIKHWGRRIHTTNRSLSVRRAWIEIDPVYNADAANKSLSVRRAWIEIES